MGLGFFSLSQLQTGKRAVPSPRPPCPQLSDAESTSESPGSCGGSRSRLAPASPAVRLSPPRPGQESISGPESITFLPLYDKLIRAGRHVERSCSSLPPSPVPSCGGGRGGTTTGTHTFAKRSCREGRGGGSARPGAERRGAARSERKPQGGAGSNRTPANSCSTALIKNFLDRAISSDSLRLCL